MSTLNVKDFIYKLYDLPYRDDAITCVFVSNIFISHARLKWTKIQVRGVRNPEAELLPFENGSLSPSPLSSKNNWSYL